MPDETGLRAKAREAIRTGRLPSRRPDRTWGGPGVGVVCTVCGEAVPSVLAVLRLIHVSNLVGCSTGRSAVLAPLRIL